MAEPQANETLPQAPPAQQPQGANPAVANATTTPTPALRSSRLTRGSNVPGNYNAANDAPALLELSSPYPMYTEQRRNPNFFVPDSQMLFHVLSICDQMMLTTDRFLRSTPAWLPIVSQLYISLLWNLMILKVQVNSGYGPGFATFLNEMLNHLQLSECLIPGPLVAFFQSLAAVNGPFDWIGDIVAALPGFSQLWDGLLFCPRSSYARQVPIPAILLDQLAHFATRANQPNGAATSTYTTFQWYRNVFCQGYSVYDPNCRIGPQLCGSLYVPEAQFNSARSYWSAALASFTRINSTPPNPPLYDFHQLFGCVSQSGSHQINWLQHVCVIMQKYCQYFRGSVPFKSISPVGIGSSLVRGLPSQNTATANWLYPDDDANAPFTSALVHPIRTIPYEMTVTFSHADHNIEEQAEQFALSTHTNINWSSVPAINEWEQINANDIYEGDYWLTPPFRHSTPLALRDQYAQVIASQYHLRDVGHSQ